MDYAQLGSWTISLLLAVVIIMLVDAIIAKNDEFNEGLPSEEQRRGIRSNHIFLKLFGPIIISLGAIISTLPLSGRDKTRKRLVQAGNPGNLTVDQYHAARIVGCGLAVLAGMFIDSEVDTAPMIAIGLGALGIIYPDIWLTGAIQKRRQRVFRDLPDILDTLRLAMDAGLDFGSAMKVVVERGREGPLLQEFERIERDTSLGLTRQEAFRNFAERLQMTEINSFVMAVIQADQLGASIGPVLKTQGDVSRSRRWQVAEVLVNKLPMKMMGPLVVFIFPASFIILFTPLLIQWMQSE